LQKKKHARDWRAQILSKGQTEVPWEQKVRVGEAGIWYLEGWKADACNAVAKMSITDFAFFYQTMRQYTEASQDGEAEVHIRTIIPPAVEKATESIACLIMRGKRTGNGAGILAHLSFGFRSFSLALLPPPLVPVLDPTLLPGESKTCCLLLLRSSTPRADGL
jgi:hypothetical protein